MTPNEPRRLRLARFAGFAAVLLAAGLFATAAPAPQEKEDPSPKPGGKKVNVVLSSNDSLALGIEQSLESKGYKVGADWPVITGQDADLANTKNMLAGKQSMTVWKDTRTLGDQVAKMVDQIVKGGTVETNDTKTYDNGVKVVPSYLLAPVVVVKDDVKTKLVDSGFYTADKLGL